MTDTEDTPAKIRRNLMVVNAIIIILSLPCSVTGASGLKILDIAIDINNWSFIALMAIAWSYCNWRFIAARHGFEAEMKAKDDFISEFTESRLRRYIEISARVNSDPAAPKIIKVHSLDNSCENFGRKKGMVAVEYTYQDLPSSGNGPMSSGKAEISGGFLIGLRRQASAHAVLKRTYFTDIYIPFLMSFAAISSVLVFKVSGWFWIPVILVAIWVQAYVFIAALSLHRPSDK